MALDHVTPTPGLVKRMPQVLEQGHHRLIAQLQGRKDRIEVAGEARIMAPQLLSLVPHVMLDLMPALKKHGFDLDLKGIIDTHVPCPGGDLRLQVLRQPEHAVELRRLELILAALGGRPFDHIEGLRHDVPADIHVIIEI